MYNPMTVQLKILKVHDRFTEERVDTYSQQFALPSSIIAVSGISQLMGSWVPLEAMTLSLRVMDTDPDTGMVVRLAEKGPGGVILEKTNQVDYIERFTYDSTGKLVQIYQEFNPDVTTSTSFSGVKVIVLDLAE
jgi:hypothetical protein